MIIAAELGIIPVFIIIAVAFTVIVWLVRFIGGIRRTNEFYRKKMSEKMNEADQPGSETPDTDPDKIDPQDR